MSLRFYPGLLAAIRRYRPQKAILFGSQVRGEGDQHSDIDLVLIKTSRKTFLERLKEFSRLLPDSLPRVDAFIYTPEEFAQMQAEHSPFIEPILKEGKTIYEAAN